MRMINSMKSRLATLTLVLGICLTSVSYAAPGENAVTPREEIPVAAASDTEYETELLPVLPEVLTAEEVQNSADDMPKIESTIYSDDFSDGIIDKRIETLQFNPDDPADMLVEEDGCLTFTRNKFIWHDQPYGEPEVQFYANEDKSGITGKVMLKFKLTKNREVLRMRVCDKNGNYLTQISWEGDTVNANGNGANGTMSLSASSEAEVVIYSDVSSDMPKFSVWVNDKKLLDNAFSSRTLDVAGIAYIKFYTLIYGSYGRAGNYTIDDFGFYYADSSYSDEPTPEPPPTDERTDAEKLADEMERITEASILSVPLTKDGYLADPLDLDVYSHSDCGVELKWESSAPDIISEDGKLTRPENDTDVTVKVTARISDMTETKEFTYRVAGMSTDIDGMPADMFPLYFDDFSDGIIDSRIQKDRYISADTLEERNGKLTFSRVLWSGTEAGTCLYLDDKHNVLDGEFVIQYTLSKTRDVVRMRPYNANWNALNYMEWRGNDLYIEYRDEDTNQRVGKTITVPSDSKMKVTLYTNIIDSRPLYTIWINNEKVLENVLCSYNMSPSNVQWMDFYTLNYGNYGKNGSYSVDNFGFYRVRQKMADADRVKKDADALTESVLEKVTAPMAGTCIGDLNLPAYGENGSMIVWSSTDESVIALDGRVTRPEAKNADVTLTAVISSGSEEIIKTFTFTVLGEHIGTGDVPTVEEMITENTFDSEEMPNKMVTDTVGGGTVMIKDGRIIIDKTDPSYSQVGVSLYTGADEAETATGLIGMEFDLERSNDVSINFRSMDANGNLYETIGWSSGGVTANHSNSPNKAGSWETVWTGKKNKAHFSLMFDTANSQYWAWIDGEQIVTAKYSRMVGVKAIAYTMFYVEGKTTVYLDNYKIYHAIPPKALRLKFDTADFSEKDLLNEMPQAGNVIKSPLNLPQRLRYGTNIIWDSTHPDIINPNTGAVNRPKDVWESPTVTLTAHMENCGMEKTQTFTYRVLRDFSNPADIAAAEAEDIKTEYITKENPREIKTSLELMEKGLYGSPIMWSSSNKNVISNSGRVTRPRFTEPNAEVTMTAEVNGYKKELKFTVLADEKPKDPMWTSDEQFFGVWNGNSYTTQPQLDYSLEGLKKVEEAAKAGNYNGARQELYNYFVTREAKSPLSTGNRHAGWSDAMSEGVVSLGEDALYYRGLVTITSDDYEAVTIPIYKAGGMTKGFKTFEIFSRYNESTAAYIMGTDADNQNMVPMLDVTVNGAVRRYRAVGAATIRAGSYSQQHYGDNKILVSKMFGDFLGDETYRALLAFDLSDIKASDTINSAQLTIYAKKSAPYADSKQLWLYDNAGQKFNEKTVCWNNLNFVVHNYNGLVGGYNWEGAAGSDLEFTYQGPRHMPARSIMTEYKYTGNEKYAYALLGQVMDCITDTRNVTPYPRTLDAGLRMQQWVPLMDTFKNSPYLTPDFCTAFMKYMYKQFEFFPTRAHNIGGGNWVQYEQLALFYATSAYPELANAASAKEICIDGWNYVIKGSFFDDGSYIEDTGGYCKSVFAMYRDFKKAAEAAGTTLPKEFDERLHKAAYYMVLLRGPNGDSLAYGDEDPSRAGAGTYSEVADWYNDMDLKFIDSFGAKGTEPDWTSYRFPDGTYTMMRSDWKTDAMYLFTSIRGGGDHGHADDNAIILMKNGKRLLVDSGKFTYNNYAPERIYGLSTEGHNTVVINDTSQRNGWTNNKDELCGPVHRWLTNSKFDLLSQSTKAYPEHEHMRNILFSKSGFVVVSDKIMPDDKTKLNNYKQYWHMLPSANIAADNEKKLICSDFDDGKNIIAASADDTNAALADGYYYSGAVENVKVGYFEKEGAGDITLDTVLYPTDYAEETVTAERLDTGKPSEEATAVKFEITKKTGKLTYYYLYNYEFESGREVCFGEYTSNARAALVGVNEKGEIVETIIADGSYIKYKGNEILKSENIISDLASEAKGSKLEIVTSDQTVLPGTICVKGTGNTKNVLFNNESKVYTQKDGLLCPTDTKAEETLESDNNKDGIGERPGGNQGGSQGGSQGGNQGGSQGGNQGGSQGGSNTEPPSVTEQSAFKDMEIHWAKEYVDELYKDGIVNGVSEGYFSPDTTVSRSEFIAMAMRGIGEEKPGETGGFADVGTDDWFAPYVAAALEMGIISYDTSFRPGDSITREEMCKIICNIYKHLKKTESELQELTFADADSISGWAEEFVKYAASNGLMNGKDGNRFDPRGNATRAESAAVLYRVLKK